MTRFFRPSRLLSGALLGALLVTGDLALPLRVPERWPAWGIRWRAWLAGQRPPPRLHLDVTPVASVAAIGPLLAALRQQPDVQGVEFTALAAGTARLHVQATGMTPLVAALLRLRGDTHARLTVVTSHRLRLTLVAADARNAA